MSDHVTTCFVTLSRSISEGELNTSEVVTKRRSPVVSRRAALFAELAALQSQQRRDLSTPGRNAWSNRYCRLGFSDLLMEEILIIEELKEAPCSKP